MWISLSIISALILGLYEVSKKHALSRNAVVPVLFGATAAGAAIFLPLVIGSALSSPLSANGPFTVAFFNVKTHGLILVKTVIVALAWLLNFKAIKHLPISIAAPFATLSPLVTITGAVFLFGERLKALQWAGLVVVLAAFLLFSLISKREGVLFHKNKWILALVTAAVLNAASALYDKFLIPRLGALSVQAWFSLYMAAVLAPVYFFSASPAAAGPRYLSGGGRSRSSASWSRRPISPIFTRWPTAARSLR